MGDCVVGGELMKVQGWGWFFFWEISFWDYRCTVEKREKKYKTQIRTNEGAGTGGAGFFLGITVVR